MIGPIAIVICVFALVGTYMTIVGRMLRSDPHWNERDQIPPRPPSKPAPESSFSELLSPRHY